ncbi:MAG: energy-coupled thiamine transporter ThiT [Ruminococcus sp.]|jgi:thiamine transporter|nr:energy-coupled thiamine transporter ThiT [Ruminococcus sp.]
MNTQVQSRLLVRLVTSAILIALAAALSNIKLMALPLGGSITLLSMLPICLLSLKYGVKWGLVCAFLYSLTQIMFDLGSIMTWGLTLKTWIGCIAFDYILPFTALGLSGIFGSKTVPRICAGITLSLVIRFVCHFISGSIVFATWCPEGWNVYLYSLAYNGSYILPEMILTIAGAVALFKIPASRKLLLA